MELRHLYYFVAVAEERHFARAAERIHLAQSPLSRQIRQLERELGVQLLERSTRSVALTDAGKVFLDEARRTIAQAEQATRMARQAQRGEAGELDIGFVPPAAFHVLPRLLQAFRERYPHVDIIPRNMSTQDQIAALQERRLHVGIVRQPVDCAPLESELLQEDQMIVALPRDHPLAGWASVPLEALRSERFIIMERERWPDYYDLVISLCYAAGFSPLIATEVRDSITLLGLVSAGIGVCLTAASYRLVEADIVFRLLAGEVVRLDYVLVWHPNEASQILREFLNTARMVRNG